MKKWLFRVPGGYCNSPRYMTLKNFLVCSWLWLLKLSLAMRGHLTSLDQSVGGPKQKHCGEAMSWNRGLVFRSVGCASLMKKPNQIFFRETQVLLVAELLGGSNLMQFCIVIDNMLHKAGDAPGHKPLVVVFACVFAFVFNLQLFAYVFVFAFVVVAVAVAAAVVCGCGCCCGGNARQGILVFVELGGIKRCLTTSGGKFFSTVPQDWIRATKVSQNHGIYTVFFHVAKTKFNTEWVNM